jgi:hypothetical protein
MNITIPRELTFEPCIIHQWIDPTGRYDPPMDRDFPFFIKLYTFADATNPCPPNWHERLEIFVGVAGDGLFHMGDRLLPFSPGDVIVVDNKKLHRTERITGRSRRAIVISFMPELVYAPGSPVCDMSYLTPFYCQVPGIDPVVRKGDARLSQIHEAINRLLRCYAERPQNLAARLGCKTYLLELLYQLSQHFAFAEAARSELLLQQQRARRLGNLLEYLSSFYGKRISVADACGDGEHERIAVHAIFPRGDGDDVRVVPHPHPPAQCRAAATRDRPEHRPGRRCVRVQQSELFRSAVPRRVPDDAARVSRNAAHSGERRRAGARGVTRLR